MARRQGDRAADPGRLVPDGALAVPPRRRRGTHAENRDLVLRTDAYNEAAEGYFAKFETPAYLLNKPFSETEQLPKHLIDAGVLITRLRLAPGDVVLELGAGSCWLSHMLNRFGCTTIGVDVSPSVLALGRQLFEADPRTNWALEPRFLVYDGHRLPLDDACCDRIVINDAFHHVPNQRELLTEMHRALRPDGILAMSEPGRGHGEAPYSVEEARHWGVLENELVLEDLAALARDCGFEKVTVIATSPSVHVEVAADDLGAFMGGKGFAQYWTAFCSALERHHYILCYKAAPVATTRRPAQLSAKIDIATRPGASRPAGVALPLTLRVTNTGDTIWLGGSAPQRGWTRLGAHLYRDGGTRGLIDYDWWRGELPPEVAPGAQLTMDVSLPPLQAPGEYVLMLDLVIEGLTWFATRGSIPASLRIVIA